MLITVSVVIDIDTTDMDFEDLRENALKEVIEAAKETPELFTFMIEE